MINIMIMLLVFTNAVTLLLLIGLMKRFVRFRDECQTIIVKMYRDVDKLDSELHKTQSAMLKHIFEQKIEGGE